MENVQNVNIVELGYKLDVNVLRRVPQTILVSLKKVMSLLISMDR